jgi:hypothetical protein
MRIEIVDQVDARQVDAIDPEGAGDLARAAPEVERPDLVHGGGW